MSRSQKKKSQSMEKLWSAGRYQDAYKAAQKRVRINPHDGIAWRVIGVVSVQKKEFESGLESLHKAEQLVPHDAEISGLLGKVLWNLGQSSEAINAYKRALDNDPTNQKALEELIQIAARTEQRDVSIHYLEKALEHEPNRIWLNYYAGIVSKELGEHDKAISYHQKVIQLDPNHMRAYNEIGLVEYSRDNNKIALEYFEKAIQAEPEHASPYYNRGIVLMDETDYAGVCEDFVQAVSRNEQHVESQYGLIRAYERQNLLDAAEDALENAEATVGRNSKIDAIAARVCLRRGNPEEARKRLESINREELDSTTYQTTLFVAGDIYERLKEADKAMQAYQEANLLQSQTSRALMFDKRSNLGEYETCCKAYTHEFVKGWPKPTQERFQKDPIFFVGFPRSGTTLLETVLDAHPNLCVLEEKPVVSMLIEQLRNLSGSYPYSLNNLTYRHILQLREYYYQQQAQYEVPDENEFIVDKLPLNSVHIGALYKIFPGAKFIFAIRHPADSILSCFMQNFRPNSAMNSFYSLEDGIYCYDLVMTLYKRYLELLPLNIISVPYEALVADLEATVRPVLDFLGVGWHDEVRKYRDRAQETGRINTPSYTQVTQPIYTRARYRWQRYQHHMEPVLDTLLSWAEYHGYVHHEDGSIDHPTVSVRQPEFAEQEYDVLPEETRITESTNAKKAGIMLESETDAGPLLVERIRKITLKNNLVRIECISFGPDGEEQVSGVMHVPVNIAEEVAQSLTSTIQKLSQQQDKLRKEAA